MQPNSSGISFSLFGFPTTIQPFFGLIALLITAANLGPINDMPFWIAQLAVGAAGVLLSILVHELGHAFSFRYLFRVPCVIVLHGFGGMAVPQQQYNRGYGFSGAVKGCFLAFSGPLAGFVLAFFTLFTFFSFFSLDVVPADVGLALLHWFLWWTGMISIFWGIINLMPIYPMDGGHIAREICEFLFPRRGIEISLILSMAAAVLLIGAAIQMKMIILAVFFGFFAYQNYQEWSFRSFRR